MSYTPGPLPFPPLCRDDTRHDEDYYTASQVESHTAAEVARAVAAERERCAVVAWSHFMVRCNHLKTNPATQDGWCAADAIRADPQRLQDTP